MKIHTKGLMAVAIAASPWVADDHRGTPCSRGPARSFEEGSITDVKGKPPCRLVLRKTGVRLDAVADGSRLDPGMTIVKDGRGRYYSANAEGWPATIGVWHMDGRFLASFGKEGEGPGELGGGVLDLYMGSGDTLHIWSFSHWSVFSPERAFVRQVPSRLMGGGREMTALLDDGRVLSGDGYDAVGRTYFRLVNPDGSLDRTFGAKKRGHSSSRAVAYSGGGTFWAGPPQEEAAGHILLEEWSVSGTMLRSLRHRASWFK